jgi:hypothetical protein
MLGSANSVSLLFNKLGPEKEDSCLIISIDVHSFNFILDCLGEPWDIFAAE